MPLTRSSINTAVINHHLLPSPTSFETTHDVPRCGYVGDIQVVGLGGEEARVQNIHRAIYAAQIEEDSVRIADVGDDKSRIRVYERAALTGPLGGVFTKDLFTFEDGADAEFELRTASGLRRMEQEDIVHREAPGALNLL